MFDMRVWKAKMGYKNNEEAAKALGCSKTTVQQMTSGKTPVCRRTELACRFLLDEKYRPTVLNHPIGWTRVKFPPVN